MICILNTILLCVYRRNKGVLSFVNHRSWDVYRSFLEDYASRVVEAKIGANSLREKTSGRSIGLSQKLTKLKSFDASFPRNARPSVRDGE